MLGRTWNEREDPEAREDLEAGEDLEFYKGL